MKDVRPHRTDDPARLAARLETAAELQAVGFRIMRGNIERRYPDETPEQRRLRFEAWKGAKLQPRDVIPGCCESTRYRDLHRE